jgi:hypothetical protein
MASDAETRIVKFRGTPASTNKFWKFGENPGNAVGSIFQHDGLLQACFPH